MAIYLDHNATTPLDGRVWSVMEPWIRERFGNASSRDHAYGWDAADAVEEARDQVAAATGTVSGRVVFTSSATEALNMVLRTYAARQSQGTTIVASAVEHEAVLATARHLCGRTGATLVPVPVDALGHVDLDRLHTAIANAEAPLVCRDGRQ